MKFKRHSIIVLVLAIIIIVGAITTFSVVLFSKVTSSTEKNQFFLLEAILKSRLHSWKIKEYN